MPAWKRVIVSGSNAVLNQISASGNIVPATDNGSDLGASNLEWKDLYIDGTAYLDSADIDGGDIASGVTINKSPVVNFNSGDVQGSITLTNLASGTGALTIQANSVALTTDTTGNYVQKVTVGTGLGGAVDSEGGTAAMTLDAAQTVITGIHNDALQIGRDSHNEFDFSTDNVIKVSVNAVDDEFRFSAGGTFHADADIVAYSSTVASDMNLKENIIDTKYGLDTIMQLRGVDFDWKREDMGRSIGVLAQEVEKIIPEVVKEYEGLSGRENFKTVDYNKLVPILIESVKTLKSEIEILKKKVN